jgi:hypothetical protein
VGVRTLCSSIRFYADIIIPLIGCPKQHKQSFTSNYMTDKTRLKFVYFNVKTDRPPATTTTNSSSSLSSNIPNMRALIIASHEHVEIEREPA